MQEIVRSMLLAPFIRAKETPKLFHTNTDRNNMIVGSCPSMKSFTPAWWAIGGYAQTLAQGFKSAPKSAPKYRREMLLLPDGVEVALDWKESTEMNDDTPLILCLHGLGGDRDSRYLQIFTDVALQRGYRTVVFNRRGHGNVSLLSKEEANTASLIFPKHINMDDMECVVRHLVTMFPDTTPKYIIGFSCGANLAINYLEHVGTQSPFVAAASISNGYDILKGTTVLRGKDAVCDGVVTQFIKDILIQGRLDESIQLAKAADIDIDFDAVMRCKSLQELEKLLVVPSYGYASLEEYYNDDTCHTKIGNVKSPLLCIANKKDPFIDVAVLEVPIDASKSNDHIMFVLTEHGGHVGWVEDLDSDPWYIRVYFEYIDALAM